MKRVLAALRALWRREPVLVSSALPVLVSVGLISSAQANAVTSLLSGAVVLVAQLGAAFAARSQVTSPATMDAIRALAAIRQAASNGAQAIAVLRNAATGAKPSADPTPPTDPKPAA